ncbi:hypothetical protein Rin_00008800 [Candidatus Regiella insecticola 5.15]|uniref:Pilus assembly protein PilP n=2 Tax=Candidatus Regiella insecticola TaxID=138073 RepID=G2GYL9_9ENTR|nr:hypothetical protein Rin_00008800 [Candidatus Regiella insecticola 5.15]
MNKKSIRCLPLIFLISSTSGAQDSSLYPQPLKLPLGAQGDRPMSVDNYVIRRTLAANNAAASKAKGIYIKDPFQPRPLPPCNQHIEYLKKWQLHGIVGQKGDHHGWVLSPEGRWYKLVVGKQLLKDWRVSNIDTRRIDIHYDRSETTCLMTLELVPNLLERR